MSDEIEITPEMIEAGAEALMGVFGEPGEPAELFRRPAVAVFQAMQKARRLRAILPERVYLVGPVYETTIVGNGAWTLKWARAYTPPTRT